MSQLLLDCVLALPILEQRKPQRDDLVIAVESGAVDLSISFLVTSSIDICFPLFLNPSTIFPQ